MGEDLLDVDRREGRGLAQVRLVDLLVAAEQLGVRHDRRVERLVDVVEHLAVDVRRVGVEPGDVAQLGVVVVVERLVLDVLTEDPLAERDVLLGVEDVRVPERVDRVGDRVLVARVEESDGVVLLECENSRLEVLLAGGLTPVGELLANLPLDSVEVLDVDEANHLELKLGQVDRDCRLERGDAHCDSLCSGAIFSQRAFKAYHLGHGLSITP